MYTDYNVEASTSYRVELPQLVNKKLIPNAFVKALMQDSIVNFFPTCISF